MIGKILSWCLDSKLLSHVPISLVSEYKELTLPLCSYHTLQLFLNVCQYL